MATIKIKFRPSLSEGKEGSLYYQVIHNRVARQIHSGYRIYPDEWDSINMTVIHFPVAGISRFTYLNSLQEALRSDIKKLNDTILRLERKNVPYTADDVVSMYLSPADEYSFFYFARNLIDQLDKIGKKCTADTYSTVMNSFARFRQQKDIFTDEIDSDLMSAYESYLVSQHICPNSISFYMRNLRAIYNRAVDKGFTIQRNPFKHVYTGIDKTVKRAVPLEIIRQIRDLDLTLHPSMDYARDMFMFSFYTRGMSFVDIAFLQKKDLQNGILTYRRHKTNQRLCIKWEKPMQELISKYDTSDSAFLLPVIRPTGKDARTQYKREVHRVNMNLKKIGNKLGLNIPLTTYVARHSWASIAKNSNIALSTISEAMGHESESTTRIYLATLDTSVVDQANSLILDLL